MLRIREAESTQAVGDLRQKIAELEVLVKPKTSSFLFFSLFYIESRIHNPCSNNG
jgi:hypothetical protein